MPLKIIQKSPLIDEEGQISLIDRLKGSLRFGRAWYAEMQAQQAIIDRMRKLLPDRFTLLRNFTLPGLEVPLPLILIGPPGVRLINICTLSGVYEAKGEQWLAFDKRTQEHEPAEPNPIARTLLFSRALQEFLKKKNFSLPPLEPVLLLTNPGIHIESTQPAVRIIQIDALKRFLYNIQETSTFLTPLMLQEIVELLATSAPEPPAPETVPATAPARKPPPGFVEKIRFTTRQWMIIGVLFAVTAMILFVFIVILFLNASA